MARTCRVFPSTVDYDNLSRLKTVVSSEFANEFDYSKVVVTKPWGYEYLWFQNDSTAIWMLHLATERSTSLHCHIRKRTSLIVCNGEVVTKTLENLYKLKRDDAMILEPCVFHSTKAVSGSGAFVLEVETPAIKGDLVRLRDDFGREESSYESEDAYSTDFDKYEYKPYVDHPRGLQFHGIHLECLFLDEIHALESFIRGAKLVAPLSGKFYNGKSVLVDSGEVCMPDVLLESDISELASPMDILVIR